MPLFAKAISRGYVAVLVSPLLVDRSDADFTPSTSIRPRALPLPGIYSLKSLFHDEVIVSTGRKVRRQASRPANMPTSLMAEVLFRDGIPPHEIRSLVFPRLESVIRYESVCGVIPVGISWKTDEELVPEDQVFSFWRDIRDAQGFDWIHQFLDAR
ncbi:MAG TPA: hypothetical protein DC054_05625 [Blastocatellia bacterium]|nr:hypothetical protein [Blastocatellia bacterium]